MDTVEFRNTLLQAFSEEAPDLIGKAEKSFLDLDESPASDHVMHCESLKRALHSFKGSASAIGRADIRDVCHAMEDMVLLIAQDQKLPERMDALQYGLQFLHIAATNPAEALDNSNVMLVLANPEHLQQSLSQIKEAEEQDVPDNNIEELPSATFTTTEIQNMPATAAENSTALTETIRVAINKIENMQSNVGEMVAIRLQQDDSLSLLNDLQRHVSSMAILWRSLSSEVREYRQYLSPTLSAKLDGRISTFTTSVKQAERQLFHLSQQMGAQTGQLSLLCDAMDTGLRAIRMMPLAPFLESFRATARDAARSLGKKVTLECEDRGIEIDRLVLEHIREPILHLVRNAVGHGIEKPEQRLALGKPETGSIRIRAELRGDYVSIAIMDDGAGFNRDRIFQKAAALGIVRSLEEMTDEKLIEIVCRPGFSTANNTDLVSGRGVGMDVVSTMILEVGGTLDLETIEGGGSCFTLRVPSSLATTQGLILQVGNACYGVVLDMVERIVRAKLDDLTTVEGREVLYLDKNPISVTSLAALLQYRQHMPNNHQRAYPIVILRSGTMRLAMIVDDIPGEIPMIVKPMGPQFERMKLYAGGAILADGSVLPVLEARHVISMVSNDGVSYRTLGENTDDTENSADKYLDKNQDMRSERSAILVVDDSITTRTLERNILEAAGYRVLVATDGVEAADILRMEDNITLVVTDMEMPRMNGIELCKHIRSGVKNRLPIIMVTSVGADSEKEKGLKAGADAYIIKGNFQQDHFLSTVRRFVNA